MFDFLYEPITLAGILKFICLPILLPLMLVIKTLRFITRLPKNIYRFYKKIKEEKEN